MGVGLFVVVVDENRRCQGKLACILSKARLCEARMVQGAGWRRVYVGDSFAYKDVTQH